MPFKWNPFTNNWDLVGTGSGGSGIATLSGEDNPPQPPTGADNFNFSGSIAGGAAANGAITFTTDTPGEMDAAVNVDGSTIIINASNKLQAIASEHWQVISASQSAANGQGYLVLSAGLVVVTLPVAPAIGWEFTVAEIGSGTFRIAQNAGDSITFGSDLTTTGAGGSITSIDQGDTLTLVCWAAGPGASWVALQPVGNFTIV
jgi:hypothetical protein